MFSGRRYYQGPIRTRRAVRFPQGKHGSHGTVGCRRWSRGSTTLTFERDVGDCQRVVAAVHTRNASLVDLLYTRSQVECAPIVNRVGADVECLHAGSSAGAGRVTSPV